MSTELTSRNRTKSEQHQQRPQYLVVMRLDRPLLRPGLRHPRYNAHSLYPRLSLATEPFYHAFASTKGRRNYATERVPGLKNGRLNAGGKGKTRELQYTRLGARASFAAQNAAFCVERRPSSNKQTKTDWAIAKHMADYLWPKGNLSTKFRVGLSVSLLLGAKVCMPFHTFLLLDTPLLMSDPIGPERPSPILLQVYNRLYKHRCCCAWGNSRGSGWISDLRVRSDEDRCDDYSAFVQCSLCQCCTKNHSKDSGHRIRSHAETRPRLSSVATDGGSHSRNRARC